MAAVDYTEFTAYGFSLSEDDFNDAVQDAQRIVDNIVGMNTVDAGNTEAYHRAICAACSKVAAYGLGPSPNFSLGSFSVGSSGDNARSGAAYAEEAALMHLVPAGLAYMGLR